MSTGKHRRRKRRRLSRGASAFLASVCALVVLLGALSVLAFRGRNAERGAAPAALSPAATEPPAGTMPPAATEPVAASFDPPPTFETVPPVEIVALPGGFAICEIHDGARPERFGVKSVVYEGDARVDAYARDPEIRFGLPGAYTALEGVTTFRGNNYRDSASFGRIPDDPQSFEHAWSIKIGDIDEWSGVGWTGQCAIVRWPEETVRIMNIRPEKKRGALTEVIYATLDGNIYFLDLEDGEYTRDPIAVGAPIKGSVTVDPRGYPLLYCGQGIDKVRGKSVKIGTRIFSLIDQSLLYFLDGRDKKAIRYWYAFDAAPLVDAETDTMLQIGENAILYLVKLNTDFDPAAGAISVDPEVDRYVFKSSVSKQPGMENSIAVYNQYGYFADNSGLLQCVNLNALACEWAVDVGDDTDATTVLEEQKDGLVALYTACELEHSSGNRAYFRKLNALTGEQLWYLPVKVRTSGSSEGGAFATPAVGKGPLHRLVYVYMTRTPGGSTLYAVDKETGQVGWEVGMGSGGWSSPVCVYSESGKGYVVQGSASGKLRLLDGLTGDTIMECDLGANIEGSPAVFDDMLVVGTRGRRIFGVKIKGGTAQ